LQFLFAAICSYVGFRGKEYVMSSQGLKDLSIRILVQCFLYIALGRKFMEVSEEAFDSILAKLESNRQFEIIFQSLEESLLIFNQDKVELVNEQFLK
jgi:hypothetical protein